jgi:hypothetical protein
MPRHVLRHQGPGGPPTGRRRRSQTDVRPPASSRAGLASYLSSRSKRANPGLRAGTPAERTLHDHAGDPGHARGRPPPGPPRHRRRPARGLTARRRHDRAAVHLRRGRAPVRVRRRCFQRMTRPDGLRPQTVRSRAVSGRCKNSTGRRADIVCSAAASDSMSSTPGSGARASMMPSRRTSSPPASF